MYCEAITTIVIGQYNVTGYFKDPDVNVGIGLKN